MLEANLLSDVGQANLIPYLQLHEYEALLFSNLNAFSYADVPPTTIAQWQMQLDQFSGPEDVINSPQTSPSKRSIAKWCYAHAKPHAMY